MANIFISRSLEQCGWLKQSLANHGHSLTCVSGIMVQPSAFTISKEVDWIFFSSSQGVLHFFHQAPQGITAKLAAMGPGTAKTLAAFGKALFIGQHTDPRMVAQQFKKKIKDHEKILFPVGKKSLRSISTALEHSLIEVVEVYDTIFQPVQLEPHDIYIFSSPSNVHSFLQLNPLNASSRVITFGPSTSKVVKENGCNVEIELTEATQKSILEAIITIFPS